MKHRVSSRRIVESALNLLYVLLVFLLALGVFVVYLRTSGIGGNSRASFAGVLAGTAHRPFVYRQLLPMTANALAPYLDGELARQLGIRSEQLLGRRFFRSQLDGRQFPSQVLIIILMMYLSLVGFVAALWCLLRSLGYSRILQYAVPPLALLASSITFNFGYMYDFPQLMLVTLALLFMYRRAWIAYLLIYCIGLLNKETMVFLVLIFAVHFEQRLPRRSLLALGTVQLALAALIQGALRYHYRYNPGGEVEWHFTTQIRSFERIWIETPWQFALWAAGLALITWLVIRRRNAKPHFIRSALSPLWLVAPLWLLFGYPLEIRNLLEGLPTIAILLLPPPSSAMPGDEERGSRAPETASQAHATTRL